MKKINLLGLAIVCLVSACSETYTEPKEWPTYDPVTFDAREKSLKDRDYDKYKIWQHMHDDCRRLSGGKSYDPKLCNDPASYLYDQYRNHKTGFDFKF